MDEVVIYEKPSCSKCRAAVSLVDASGMPVRRVRYHEKRLNKDDLTRLIAKLGMRPRELVRTNEPLYKELGAAVDAMSDKEVIALLAKHPDLLERPILECGDRAILGRPTERVSTFLEELSKR